MNLRVEKQLTIGLIMLYCFAGITLYAQDEQPITSAVPFLRITPDARSGAMGDVGIGLSPDANAVHFNSAKLPFAEKRAGVAFSYSPWLRSLGVTDVYLAHFAGYYKFNERQSIQSSLRFFSLGNIVFTDINAQEIGEDNPNELALDVGYAIKLSDHFGIGAAVRYIFSDLASGQQTVDGFAIKAGHAVGVDISTFYHKKRDIGKRGMQGEISFGATISNLGSKISYTNSSDNEDFLPANLGLGTGFNLIIDSYSEIGFYVDVNKLLVPSFSSDSSGGDPNVLDFKEKTSIAAVFSSFGDAEGGFKEELREMTLSLGAEYWYNKQFAVRLGYFMEADTKGNRKYLTAGVGVRYSVFGLDFSYLAPVSSERSPLDNTIRFTLQFNFGDKKKTVEENELLE